MPSKKNETEKINEIMENTLEVKVMKRFEGVELPSYANPGDAGMDVKANGYIYDSENDLHIYHTGLYFELPKGYVMLVFPRSSNTKKECYLPNSVGILDSGYRGELLFKYKNRDANDNSRPYKVGDKVGQIVILPYPTVRWTEVNELSDSERGENGFGSTGN